MQLKQRILKKCPLCGNPRTQAILDKHTHLRNMAVEVSQTYVICTHCSFIFTKNPLSEAELARYYRSNTQERTSQIGEREARHIQQQINFLNSALIPPTGAILEIGANNGVFLEAHPTKSEKYYVELNSASVSILQDKPYLKDFTKYKGKTKRVFSQIILLHTLEHIVEPRRFIKSLSNHLEMGGVFFVEVPDFTIIDRHTDDLIFEHVNFFSEKTLRLLFEHIGLTVIASEISLDVDYPACPNYVLRMIAKKCSSVPLALPKRTLALRKRQEERDSYFRALDSKLKALDKEVRIGIYSASWLTVECLEKTRLLDYHIVSIFDRDPKKQGTVLQGVPVYSPDRMPSEELDYIFVLNEGYEKEIRQYFDTLSLSSRVYWWSDFQKPRKG